jgi:superfamily II DNA or RNA helicase
VWAGARKEFSATKQLQVICSETLKRRTDNEEFMEQLGKADIVYIDEAHLLRSKPFIDMIEQICHDKTAVIGMTATPWVTGLDKIFSKTVHTVTPKELLEQGYLAPFRIVSGREKIDTDAIKIDPKTRDYRDSEAEKAVMKTAIYDDIITTYQRWCDGKRAIVFAASKKHADVLQTKFTLAGYTSAMVIAETPPPERETIFNACRAGKIQILVSVDALSEGLDVVEIEAVLLCKPTKSLAKYIQRVGRGARISPKTGKTFCWILDFVGCVHEHGTPYDDRDYYLPKEAHKASSSDDEKEKIRKPWECSECGAINENQHMECHGCGALRPKPKKTNVITLKQEMVEYSGTRIKDVLAALPIARKQSIYSALIKYYLDLGQRDVIAYWAWKGYFDKDPGPIKKVPGPWDEAARPIIEFHRQQSRAWAIKRKKGFA